MSDQRFVRTFGVTFLLLAIALGTASVLLDVTGTFGLGLTPAVENTSRDEKAERYHALAVKPEVVVVGTSRAWALRAECVAAHAHADAFNFGVDAGNAEDFLAVIRYVLDHDQGRTRRVLLEIEPEALILRRLRRWRGNFSRWLRPYYDRSVLSARVNGDVLFGAETITANWTALKNVILFLTGSPHPPPRFDAHGDANYEPEHDLDAEIGKGITLLTDFYRSFHELAPRRLIALRAALELAKERQVAVDAIIPPIHPAVERGLSNTSLLDRRRDLKEAVRVLQAEGLIRTVYDYSDVASFGGDPDLFEDYWHISSANGARALDRIFGDGTSCALQ